MPDRPQSTREQPADWESKVGFHAALLRLFPDSEDAAALRRTGQLLYTMAVEIDGNYDPPEDDSPTRSELRAAVTDLEMLRDFLIDLGLKVERVSMDFEDAKLCILAAECGEGIGRVVDAIAEGLKGAGGRGGASTSAAASSGRSPPPWPSSCGAASGPPSC